jgi:S-adenosylmethionine:tRNA ribosyltransferase-isomerase
VTPRSTDISLFDYDLPPELIAQFPTRRRDQSRLMVLDRSSGEIIVRPFKSVTDYLRPGDAIVVNSTKVFKARLFGRRATGARVELFLVRPSDPSDPRAWEALVSPSRRVKVGEEIQFDRWRVLLAADLGGGRWMVTFHSERQRQNIIARCGHVPLPHYIKRDDQPSDLRRYQTIFADKQQVGAVAAPTAGFHFTRSILDGLQRDDIEIIRVCLHVGPGTFKPVKTDDIESHVVDPEMATLLPDAAAAINRVRKSGGKIIAVGTTSVRTIESAPIRGGEVQPYEGMVDLYIRPGYRFKLVDHLVTNFHLPKSSLLILVSALAGRECILNAYREAIRQRMRFYSYGDAMLIV